MREHARAEPKLARAGRVCHPRFSAPALRRRGAARALLHALAESARAEQMRELYLMVELENAPARALYAASGFRELYRYHYRERERHAERVARLP